jgi:chemotaxis protein histidine kinase CheA
VLLLALEAVARGVLPHHVLCDRCPTSSSSSSSCGGGSRCLSDAAQHLRLLLADFHDIEGGMLSFVCINVLQNGFSSQQQQQQQQQLESRHHQQQQQQQGQSEQQLKSNVHQQQLQPHQQQLQPHQQQLQLQQQQQQQQHVSSEQQQQPPQKPEEQQQLQSLHRELRTTVQQLQTQVEQMQFKHEQLLSQMQQLELQFRELQLEQQQQQQREQQQQRLLHLWSCAVSLLKLPVRPVTGVPLITGCIHMVNIGLSVLQLTLQQPRMTLAQQRLVLAPWLALTGRCLLAMVRVLRAARLALCTKLLSEDATSLVECARALLSTAQRLPASLDCWEGVSSSGSGTDSGSGGDSGSSTHVPSAPKCLQRLTQQLQADSRLAADLGSSAVAAASAAAASVTAYLPAYGGLRNEHIRSFGPQIESLVELLGAAQARLGYLHTDSDSASSSDSGSDDSRTPSSSSTQVQVHVQAGLDRELAAIRRSPTTGGCWIELMCSDHYCSAMEAFEQLGLVLCNQLPMPWLCNNPHCSNLSGVSELQLVGGKACVCGCCRLAR